MSYTNSNSNEKAKLVLRLPTTPTMDDYPACKKVVDQFKGSKRILSKDMITEEVRRELRGASQEITEVVLEAFGTSSKSALLSDDDSSQFDSEEDDEDVKESETSTPVSSRRTTKKSSPKRNRGGAGTGGKSTASHQQFGPDGKPKIPNQVPITTFWTFIEAFFKTLDEGDLKFLDDPAMPVDATLFLIPPLGKRYEQQWRELYGFIVQTKGNSSQTINDSADAFVSLPTRILSMLIDRNVPTPPLSSTDEQHYDQDDTEVSSSPPSDYLRLNDRISAKLAEFGLQNVPSQDFAEDDAICTELRSCQAALREQMYINHMRKQRLAARVRQHLPIQEFYAILLEIDKQIDGTFQRRVRASKKRKRSAFIDGNADADEHGSITDLMRLVEDRFKLVAAFANIFPDQLHALLPEPHPIVDEKSEKNALDVIRKEGNWLPLPLYDMPSCTTPTLLQ